MANDTPIPQGLRDAKRWVLWAHRQGRKPPVGKDGLPLKDWNDPETFLGFDEAMGAFMSLDGIDGVGFVLGDGFGGLDLDECRAEDGTLDPKAQTILAALPDCYTEISPSGKGIKIFGRTTTPGFLEINFKSGAIEIKPSGYFCLTGRAIGAGRQLSDLNYAGLMSVLGAPPAPTKSAPAKPLARVIPPGSQEGAMFREACRLRRLGYEVSEIAKMLWTLVENGRFPNETGREAWTYEDCAAKARTVEKYESAQDTYPTTDPGCAEYLKATQGDSIRHDVDRGVWLLFDNVRWAADQIERIRMNVTDSLRARQGIAARGGSPEKRRMELIKNENRVESILKAAVPYFPSRTTEFDKDRFLLGVPNGVVDLRTGKLRAGSPEDNISMQAAFPYDPEAKAPLWESTVSTVFAKDGAERPDFVGYVQRALGYSITGACNEEVFFLCTGRLGDEDKSGRNGKGTLVNTIAKVLGDYACDLGFSSLEWQRNGSGAGSASPDLAKLVHKRFVTASETNRGSQFNTARIKALTGRDPITARFLFKNEFTFEPELKLWLSVNHPPRVEDDSLGFWSRPHVVEFPNTFASVADTTLKDRLIEEGEGILAWLVRGALEWQKDGLKAPPEVRAAVQTYQEAQGDLEEFLDTCCVVEAAAEAAHSELWDTYSRWTQSEHRQRSSSKDLGKRLRKRFGEPRDKWSRRDGHNSKALVYHGVGIRTSSDQGAMF